MKRFAVFTAGFTWLLLAAGGLVTSTRSGLAVPDWPLSYGRLMPAMSGGILFEHSHRMIAGVAGLLILMLAVWIWRKERRYWVRWVAAGAAIGVIAQAVLGGLTVLLRLPPVISIAHAVLAQTVFCLVLAAADFIGHPGSTPSHPDSKEAGSHPQKSFIRFFFTDKDRGIRMTEAGKPALAAAMLYLQLVSGAIVRHTGHAFGVHLWLAVCVALVLGWAAWSALLSASSGSRVSRPALWAMGLLLAQIFLGIGAFAVKFLPAGDFSFWPAALPTAHLACGAALLGVTVLWTLRAAHDQQRDCELSICATRLFSLFRDLTDLAKPRIAALAATTAACGFWLAGGRSWSILAWTVLGTVLSAAATGALNQFLERRQDALMQRTRTRPLPEGRLAPMQAFWMGLLCILTGTLILLIKTHPMAAVLTAITSALYLTVYTPLKRVTPLSTWFGAAAGAMPPVIGWVAAAGRLEVGAWILFAIQFLWQIPHFLALFWIYRQDYARAGFRVMPVVDQGGGATACQIAIHSFAVLPASLLPFMTGMAGGLYTFGALALGIAYMTLGMRASWTLAIVDARRLFLGSLAYLPLIFILLLLGGNA